MVTAIVLAAGRGIRFKSGACKLLAKINSKPLISYCLKTLNNCPSIKDIVLVVSARNQRQITSAVKKYRINKLSSIVRGGKRRQDSVSCGLKAIRQDADLVLIHDAARPFVDKKIISSVISEAGKSGAAIVGVPVKDTIKTVKLSNCQTDKYKLVAKRTINRDNLWEAQTPQVFRRDLILRAYRKFGHIDVTDDAALVEKLGAKVIMVMGSDHNIKITTSEDLAIAEAILKLSKLV